MCSQKELFSQQKFTVYCLWFSVKYKTQVMASFKRFEDIEAWQSAREISKAVYKVSGLGPFAKDFELKNKARSSEEFGNLYCNIDTCTKMIAGLISYLNQSTIKGEKFKNRVN